MPNYIDIPALGGINLLDDPRRIRDDELVRAQNIVPFTKGMLRKRPGAVCIGGVTESQLFGAPVPGLNFLGFYKPIPGVLSVYVGRSYSDDEIVIRTMLEDGTTATTWTGSGYQSDTPNLFVFNGYVYVIIGGNTTVGAKINVSSTAAFTFNGTNNGFMPAVCGVYRRRGVFANLGTGYENSVVFSDADDLATIGNDVRAINGRSFTLGSVDGDRIVAGAEITQSEVGSPSESAYLLLKEYSAYVITGEPNETTDTGDMLANLVVNKISYACGCSSPRTLVNTPYGIIWAGPDDVWLFATGSLPKRIGTKIRPALEATPAQGRFRWHAAYYNGFYRLAVFAPGDSVSYTDRPAEQYWLDLRNGPPQGHEDAMWWGPQKYRSLLGSAGEPGTDCFVLTTAPGVQQRLMGPVRSNGAVYVHDFDTAERGRDTPIDGSLGTPIDPRVSDASDIEIATEIITKEYDFGDRLAQKGFLALRADYWTNITDYLRLDTRVDGGFGSDTSTVLCEQSGLLLGVDAVESALTRKFQETVLYPSTRIVGKTLQFKIYDTAGYVIGAYNDQIVLTYSSVDYAITLTQGYYANLKALLDHICSVIPAGVNDLAVTAAHNVSGPGTGNRATTITLSFNTNIIWKFQTAGGSITAEQLRKSRAVGALLGYDTSANTANSNALASSTTVYYKQVTDWEFGGFEVEYDVFPRGPA